MQKLIDFLAKNTNLIFRIGLAFVFLYAGISSLVNPLAWIGFVPAWLGALLPLELFLLIHGISEIALGIFILFSWLPKIVYALAALDLLAILAFYGLDDISFRDGGLLFLALGLWLESLQKSVTAAETI